MMHTNQHMQALAACYKDPAGVYSVLGKHFSMAVDATCRIRKVSAGLERQVGSVAVVELAAVKMSDSAEVIIASSSGVLNEKTMRGRGKRRRT
jgi:hypothetical protein